MKSPSVVISEVTSPDEVMTVLKRYLRKSNESEIVVSSRIAVNRPTLNRWLTTNQSQVGVSRMLSQARRIAVSFSR